MISIVKTLLFALAICLSSSAFAQIPVTVTSDIPSIINQIQTMAQWAKQYDQMVGQINQMKQQYGAITGTRNLGQISNPQLHNYLPDEWAGIYDKVKNGKLAGISGSAASIATAEGFDPKATGGQKRYQDTLAANKAITMQSYDKTLARLNNINALMKEADATQDAKASADLQNRIASENAMIQNEQIRLNLVAQLQQTELKLAEEQRSREFKNKYFK